MDFPLYVRTELHGFGAYLHDKHDRHLGYMGSAQNAATIVAAVNEVAELREQLATAHKALEFYRDGFQFTTNKRYGGLEWTPTESLLDDCGNIARSTLIEAERP